MLSYQILDYYEFINKELEIFKGVLNPIFEWSQTYFEYSTDALTKLLKSNVSSGTDGTHYVIKDGKIKTGYDEIVKSMKSVFSSYIIFKAFGEFKQKIKYYKVENDIRIDDYINDFIEETENLFETYQEFQKDDTNQIKMINFANELMKYRMLFNNTIKMYSDYYLLSTNNDKDEEKNARTICIQLLEVEYTMDEFVTILKDINDSYLEIGNLIFQNSKISEYKKIRILKIESGSLFSKISGEKIIIDVLKKVLTKAITWLHTKIQEGDSVLTHQKFASALKEDAELMKMLEENGCDISASKENMEKAFNLLSKQALHLAKSTSNIKIDNEEFNMKGIQKQKFLNGVKENLLNSGEKMKEEDKGE